MKYLFVILMLSVIGCGGDEWTKRDGLSWSDVSAEAMTYDDAIDYCEDMGACLPTIDELRTLIKNCPVTETGGESAVTNSCVAEECWDFSACSCSYDYDNSGIYNVFGDTLGVWSSITLADNTDYAWGVNFFSGYVGCWNKTHGLHARCVR